MTTDYVRWFKDIRLSDVPQVGGKNASLGELYASLSEAGVRVPNGFAVTADAYRDGLERAKTWPELHALLDGLSGANVALLAERAAKARAIVHDNVMTDELRAQILGAYAGLREQYGDDVTLAVRSSATAEDLPEASFAGQHESYLNVRGPDALIEACRNCFASLFTDRAIVYRLDNGFDHFKVALSIGIMKMVRSDRGASGVMFTLDTETGFRDVVLINAIYGLGENIVQGRVDPDQFTVHKPTFRAGSKAVLRRRLGSKELRLVCGKRGDATRNITTTRKERGRFCITDSDVLALAAHALAIEDHFAWRAGHDVPMDIEWAKDGGDGELYIVQARPETAASRLATDTVQVYALGAASRVIVTGEGIGEKIATGPVRVVASPDELGSFRPGEILVADTTTPDWQPVMKIAAAIVTNRGGRTCHAAIVARELGLPAIVGCGDATTKLKTGQVVTVSCAESETGHVYDGVLPIKMTKIALNALPHHRTKVMVNLGDPDLAFRTAMLPNDGVGLARMEFIIQESIGIHPMALAQPEKIVSEKARGRIRRITQGYKRPADFFVERLSEGVGTIAAAFYPKPVIVRLSDFKTNEYARLIGGEGFEPHEENPMLGFRGASRYAHPAYAPGFALECAALKRVRDEMGLTNLRIMVPFCRRESEARQVVEAMAANGLKRGENALEIYVMCEIPNNVIRIDGFAAYFDGFSIGTNDLTQLTLGVDRDSEIVAFDFDERDPGMTEMLRLAVTGAHRNRRHVGICGEAPANYPEVAKALVRLGIDSISVNPASLVKTIGIVAEAEQEHTRDAA
jgi:pyruvate,water dikinase